jgi:hypothetical protein
MKTENAFLTNLKSMINASKEALSNAPKGALNNKLTKIIENVFYSEIIKNYKNNLNKENMNEFNISEKDIKKIYSEFRNTFDKCNKILSKDGNYGNFTNIQYGLFKNKLKKICINGYNLLLELEKVIDLVSCEKSITKFKKEAKNLGFDVMSRIKIKYGKSSD